MSVTFGFKDICNELRIDENKGIYWKSLLKKADLIHPKKGLGNKDIYSEDDLETFRKLQEYMEDGATSATEAVRLLKDNVSPEEALRRYRTSQRELEVTQKKLLALRKPFWERMKGWLGNAASKLMFWRND